ncbi:hypothetical protein CLPUN_37650 [Clostridium puniceum]|uniref:Uncharacterized protein n=1 Tax=Clostridium puniceum TaxID=29367 RepID=A0A1S8TA28_9CLOT|nr:hypothetical protein CLPUN_37650 [Clostridium puniceum]
MKNKTIKLILSSLVILIMASFIIGCGNERKENYESITIGGSSALLPLMEKTIEKFNEKKTLCRN